MSFLLTQIQKILLSDEMTAATNPHYATVSLNYFFA